MHLSGSQHGHVLWTLVVQVYKDPVLAVEVDEDLHLFKLSRLVV